MQACRTLTNSWQQSASRRKPMLLSGLLLILWISLVGSAFGEQGADFTFDVAIQHVAVQSAVPGHSESALPEHWQELAVADLEGIRGRYVPATEVDLNAPWSVILWDEGRGGHSGSGNGSGSHQTQQGNNQQRQSLSTTTVR